MSLEAEHGGVSKQNLQTVFTPAHFWMMDLFWARNIFEVGNVPDNDPSRWKLLQLSDWRRLNFNFKFKS